MKRYSKACNTRYRKANKETNDCGVIAMSIVCRTTYKAAHKALQRNGRKQRNGATTYELLGAVVNHGFKIEGVKKLKQKNGSRYTPKTIGDKLNRGYYLCFCNNHVFAVVNGDVEDWTEGRKHHITQAYKVIRKRT